MFSDRDRNQLQERNISVGEAEEQLRQFERGFSDIPAVKPAVAGDGILRMDDAVVSRYAALYEENLPGQQVLKFVPASGAATRMFKDLYEALQAGKDAEHFREFLEETGKKEVLRLLDQLRSFAFYRELEEKLAKRGIDPLDPSAAREVLQAILGEEGLHYGNLPKGLIRFHSYGDAPRTAAEEHLVEGALYARDTEGNVHIHFTVSPEHLPLFRDLTDEKIPVFENRYGVKYEVDFSVQKPSTDTLAANPDNTPFREPDGSLLFRPGGHGALLDNLDELPADLIFIKNIDNVVPDRLKAVTVEYKKALAGLLLSLRKRVFAYLRMIEDPAELDDDRIREIARFLEQELCLVHPAGFDGIPRQEKLAYLFLKLNRPIRVCGMVRNEGEPGGGPFWVRNADGSMGLQIAESSQFNLDDPKQQAVFSAATHFNPVDLVCSTRDHRGEPFPLKKFRDPGTGFISSKSKDGRALKALELPGLWNGAMADWNTVFVEVPVETFNPVKTIMDLLRKEHL